MIDLIETPVTALVEDLFDRIDHHTPSSFLRFNDGEGKIVGCPKYYSGLSLVGELRTHFGTNLFSNDSYHALRDRMSAAFHDADWIGIPPASWPPLFTRARDVVQHVLFPAEAAAPRLTHVSFPQHLLETGCFERMLRNAPFLGLVGCRDLRRYFKDNYGVQDSHFIGVPEQGTASYSGYLAPHFPGFVDAVMAAIDVPRPGALFLVGAGFCGKLYCQAIKARGGIAIDVGSLFDMWAGRFTRPYMNFDQIVGYYRQRMESGETAPEPFHAVADFHRWRNEPQQERVVVERALAVNPTFFDFNYRMVDVLLRLGSPAEAEAFANRAAARCAFSGVELSRVAKLFLVAEQREEGCRLLTAAVNQDPTFEPTLVELANFHMPSTEATSRGLAYRVMDLMAHFASLGTNYQLLNQYARMLGAYGKYSEAIDAANASANLFSYDPTVYEQKLGWEKALGRPQEAERSLTRAAELRAAHLD